MLGVYTAVLFADCGISLCLVVRRWYKQWSGDCILSNNCFTTESIYYSDEMIQGCQRSRFSC